MAFEFAGRYGPEIFMDDAGDLLRNKPVTVFLPGTAVLADLFLDRAKAVPAANPFLTDARGNGYFYADPGEYDLSYAGWVLPVTVDMDPEEAQGGGPPTGPAGGALGGFYPDPTLNDNAVTTNKIAPAAVTHLKVDASVAKTTDIDALRTEILGAAPETLNALNELAAALGNDPNFATSMATALGLKVDRALYDANSLLIATADNTPIALAMAASTVLMRAAAGNIVAGTPADLRTLIDFANQVRLNRLDQMAAPTAAVAMNNQKITGMAVPTAAGDAATKGYVDPEGWIAVLGGIGFSGAWGNVGGGAQTARYRKRGTDVEIEGAVAGGADGGTVFTLPVGYRPAATQGFAVMTNVGVANATIANTGGLTLTQRVGTGVSAITYFGRITFSTL